MTTFVNKFETKISWNTWMISNTGFRGKLGKNWFQELHQMLSIWWSNFLLMIHPRDLMPCKCCNIHSLKSCTMLMMTRLLKENRLDTMTLNLSNTPLTKEFFRNFFLTRSFSPIIGKLELLTKNWNKGFQLVFWKWFMKGRNKISRNLPLSRINLKLLRKLAKLIKSSNRMKRWKMSLLKLNLVLLLILKKYNFKLKMRLRMKF